jgi:shikimate dehydrogenase
MERARRPLYEKSADAALRNDCAADEAARRLAGILAPVLTEAPKEGYAVIGSPIAHTLSPVIHGAVFAELGLCGTPYVPVLVPAEALGVFAEKARRSGLKGFNVTIPHKSEIISFLDEVEDEARLCGAVNAVAVRGGRLCGYNADMGGLLGSLREHGREYRDRRILVLGAGGAARGVVFKAAREGAAGLTILNRRTDRAESLAAEARKIAACPIGAGPMSLDSLRDAASSADILINATPAGMTGGGENFPSLDFLRALPKGAFVCDLVYKPSVTKLLREARKLGLASQNGLGMLIRQAVLSDEIFLGRKIEKPVFEKICEKIRANLQREGE